MNRGKNTAKHNMKSMKRTFRTAIVSPVVLCVIWVLVIIGLSRACTPDTHESIELKAYRAGVIVEARTRLQGQDILAIVTKTLKGDIGDQEQILVTGFGTEQPCFYDNTDLEENGVYVFYLTEDVERLINVTQGGGGSQTRTYLIVANPDNSSGSVRRKIRKAHKQGKMIRQS